MIEGKDIMGIRKEERIRQRNERLGEIRLSKEGCLMKIVEYNNVRNIIVEFQDDYKYKTHTNYDAFLKGNVKNYYFNSIYGVGRIGCKYKVSSNRIYTKEYVTWNNMLKRCYDQKYKDQHETYKNVMCCIEWLLYENFYEWIHSQENFDKWLNEDGWALDKDILVKGNKIYSPETCCLIPNRINKLFTKSDEIRGNLPIGVCKIGNKFQSSCLNPFAKKKEYLGLYDTAEEAFYAYKKYKEEIIKQVACFEYSENNINSACYEAMMDYVVEIED